MRPERIRAPRGSSPSTESAVIVLPLPDSPISPTISPARTSRSIRSTTRATPRREANSMLRSAIARAAGRSPLRRCPLMSVAQMRVEEVAQAVAQEIKSQDADEHRQARHDAEPGILGHEAAAGAEHVAPGRLRRLSAEAEEAQRRFEQHG